MKAPRNDIHNLSTYTHVRIKIYREFYHGIIYISNEECHVRIAIIKLIFKVTDNLNFRHLFGQLIGHYHEFVGSVSSTTFRN